MTTQKLPSPVSVVPVTIEPLDVTIVADVDELSAGNVCSCAAGDDNPF
ncbi:hypothetical protein [Actinomadura craniellae]|nr:hypothetical protein [Actinomadura craniellae]